MLVQIEKNHFVIGKFTYVINFILDKISHNSKSSTIFLPCTLHELAMQKNDKKNTNFLKNIDYCTSDSMLITNFFRYQYKKEIDRVYGPDLMLAILDKHDQKKSKIKHYLLGPDKKTIQIMKKLLSNKYPNIDFFYDYLPKNISKYEEQIYLKKIITKKPDLVWIGIGSPKQLEISSWLKNHSNRMIIFCVGAAFGFISGQKKQAPVWMQKNNLEWLFRLLNEPKRLWRRYLITIPKYLISFISKNSN